MHPAFRLENLKSLSPSVQLRANLCSASFQINRHQPTFASETFAITPENVEPLLPVWYANLDPATIPNVDAIDAAQLAGERIHAVLGAELALKAIWGVKNVPPEVYPKLWARVWPWMQFLHTYRQHLNLNSRKEQDLYAPFMQTLRVFQRCNPSQFVEATPGVRVVVGTAWDLALKMNGAELEDISFLLSWDLDTNLKAAGRRRVKEYMEGGGGGIEHFTSMLRQHLDRAIIDRATPMSQLGLWHFNPGMGMLSQVLKQPGMSDAFQAALLRHGIVGALVSGMYSLHLVEGNHTIASSMTTAATLVRQLISRPPGLAWVSEALRAGFLPIFLRTAHAFRDEDKLRQEFEYQLAQLFSPYMVYRSILTLMPDILTQVADLVKSDAFMASPLFAPWQRFQALVEDRLTFLQEFALTPSILHKACDNLACNQVLLKAELKRCVCLDLYYCSKQCQIADWREGHREVCRNVCGLRSLPEEQQLTVHDRAFLRALLRRDYLAFRRLTYARQVSDWAQTLEQPRLFFLDFNYMAGPVAIANRRWNYSKLSCMGFPPQWLARFRDHAVRAWKSEGLLEVHVMAIPHGLKKHWKIIPMRHTRPEIVEGLWAIARNVAGMQPTDPMFDSTVANELQPLLKIDPQFIYE